MRKTFADHEVQHSETERVIITPDHLTASNFKTAMKQKSHNMAEIIKELVTGIEGMPLGEAIDFIKSKSGIWYGFKDDCLSTVLHVVVERNLGTLVECLMACDAEGNSREGCGVTPLHLAVFHGHIEVVRTLLRYDAKPSGTFPGNIPSLPYTKTRLGKLSSFYKTSQLKLSRKLHFLPMKSLQELKA